MSSGTGAGVGGSGGRSGSAATPGEGAKSSSCGSEGIGWPRASTKRASSLKRWRSDTGGGPFCGYAWPVPSIPERITTERLLIRCWEPADAPALRAAIDASLDQLREWLPWALSEPTPVEELAFRLEAFAHR